jgi:hypothetical protein
MTGVMLLSGVPGSAQAGVDVGVSINIGPPPIVVAEPPEVVMVPRSNVYFVPSVRFDVFFHDGYWWSPRGDGWYRSRAYNGPWRIIERRHVPGPVVRVPREYRTVYVKEKPIPYGQWKKQHAYRDGKGKGKNKGKKSHDGKGKGGHDDYGDHGRHGHDDHQEGREGGRGH